MEEEYSFEFDGNTASGESIGEELSSASVA
jgi:hypothetical protein